MQKLKMLLALPSVAILLAATGCQTHSKSENYVLISSDLNLPYWQTVPSKALPQ